MTQNSKIWLSSPHMGEEEWKNVQEAFRTNWIAPVGPFLQQFEQGLAERTQNQACAALHSGTAAIHLALHLLGVGKGDVVLCQSLTFVGSANPILYQGAIPVYIDSELQTWNICPEALETAIKHYCAKNKKPKAIIAVDLYGMPAQWEALQMLSEKYEIPIIEDAAEALGSTYKGKPCGAFGHFGVLSFNGNKIITTSGGGALVSNDVDAIAQARFLATQAKENTPHYEHTTLGYNYRLSNVSAAIGVGQLQVLEDRILAKRQNHDFYQALFGDHPGIQFLEEPEGSFSNRWLSCILIEEEKAGFSAEKLRLHLEKQNIESRPLWKPMHLQPLFKDAPYFGGNIAKDLFLKGQCLPSGSNLTPDEKERIQVHIKALF